MITKADIIWLAIALVVGTTVISIAAHTLVPFACLLYWVACILVFANIIGEREA